jgi:hypothetical protein
MTTIKWREVTPMHEKNSGGSRRGYVADAARIIGISESKTRRAVDAGLIVSERLADGTRIVDLDDARRFAAELERRARR